VTHDSDASPSGDAPKPNGSDAQVRRDAQASDAPLTRDERLTLAVMEVLEGAVPSARAAALKHDVDPRAVQRRVTAARPQSQPDGQGPLARAGSTDTQ